jgi:hypothetical protein
MFLGNIGAHLREYHNILAIMLVTYCEDSKRVPKDHRVIFMLPEPYSGEKASVTFDARLFMAKENPVIQELNGLQR